MLVYCFKTTILKIKLLFFVFVILFGNRYKYQDFLFYQTIKYYNQLRGVECYFAI